ncbi:MAG: calcium-translocating P-type ATPase, PMCA-type [Clostridiales bacterium]|nr:calcium-translocating P-type ATPase, PMCA-type [Clostridiales bacterium]
MKRYAQDKETVLTELNSNADKGLTVEEAEKRLSENGKNKLAEGKKKSLVRRFFEQLTDPMIIILLVAAVISGALTVYESIESGKGEFPTDVIIILAVVLLNAVLGVMQESKAEKAIEALQKMSAATSKVIRDGKLTVVHSEDLVVGDIVLLEAGDSVPADGRVIESASLQVEEAALTGESVPVSKVTEAIIPKGGANEVTLGDRKNMVYMGSTVVYGRGVVVVTATGMDTEMGKIAGALSEAQEGKTPLQRKLAQLSKILTWLVLGISLVVFAIKLFASNFEVGAIIDSFMVAVSLAVAAIPEGLASVVTVVLSIGVTNMSKRNAIIRKLTAVETLGCAQIICSDKTGTLTQNKMTVVKHYGEDEKRVAIGMALCSDAEVDDQGDVTGEPTEAALVAWAYKLELPKYELKAQYNRVQELPFDSNRKMMSTFHPQDGKFVQYTKGAPDVVIGRCAYCLKGGKAVPMTDELKAEIFKANKEMADNALRVLACAERIWDAIPENLDSDNVETEMCFTGLCGMIDPVRPEVKVAIEQCREAGIRPIMITGDHVDTAIAIAKELGILEEGMQAITGAQLNELSDEEFEKQFQKISVYARVQPEHKTRIVNAWKKYGFVTAMTGDGVNDAPSIKSADIGVGMGITGTDVTKNVADMVLADDNFATIVGAVEEGRRIYDNIRKAIQFLLGSNMSEVIAIFVATLMGFSVLSPVHLLWINLVTDTFPALALGTEKAEKDVMKRKPRDSKSGVFADGMGFDILYQGLLVAILVLVSYFVGHFINTGNWVIENSTHGTTMAFLTMAMAEIFHSLNMRSQRKSLFTMKQQNKLLWLAALGSSVLSVAVCAIPPVAKLFGFTPIGFAELGVAIAIGFAVIPVVELVKCIQRAVAKKKNK